MILISNGAFSFWNKLVNHLDRTSGRQMLESVISVLLAVMVDQFSYPFGVNSSTILHTSAKESPSHSGLVNFATCLFASVSKPSLKLMA